MVQRPADPSDVTVVTKTEDAENISVDSSALPRGASEGPLAKLIPVYVDVETFMSEDVSLDSMTLRQYLAASYLTALAVAVGNDDPVQVFFTKKNPGPPGSAMVNEELQRVLQYLAANPEYVFVAHNASFDMRVLRFHLGVPHPVNVWCSMEGAMGAWPECPGGFGLANLTKRLRLPADRRKLELDLKRLQKLMDKCPLAAAKADELVVLQMKTILKIGGIPWPADDVITKDLCLFVLAIYNQRDVESMREVFLMQAARISAVEQGVALRTHHQRRHHFMVDGAKLDEFVVKMDENAGYAEKEVEAMVGTGDLRAVFNRDNDNGMLTSIRYARLKKLVNEKLAQEQFESTSLKKLSPLQLARNPKVFELLTQTTRAGKMMSHKRRAKVFHGVTEVDVELGWCRAHTGRFSSPSTGKGLNIHNVPKHDKAIAEPVRKLFKVPPGFCLVRGDLANVEFRCLLEGSQVLTDSGRKNIENVLDVDLVWDGIAFVEHGGVVCNGNREVIEVHGVWMTPDHPVLTSRGWVEAEKAAMLTFHSPDSGSAGGLVRAPTPSIGMGGTGSGSPASAAGLLTSPTPTCSVASAENAVHAQLNADGENAGSYQIRGSARSGSTATSESSPTASTPSTQIGNTTAAVGSLSTQPCVTEKTSSGMSSPLLAGTTRHSPSIGLITTETTGQETSAVQREPCKQPTSGARTGMVYDIMDCGPRNRFVAGQLIVHNCEGYLTGATNVFRMFEPLKGGNPFTDPYSSTWQNMTSMKISKKDPVRQVAKSATLGLGFCLDGDTPVITMSGVKLIKDVLPGDMLWNGSAWVKAGGAIKTGRKQCIRLGNTWLTGDHQVWWNGWHRAADVADALATKLLERAGASGAGLSSLLSSTSGLNAESQFDATAELNLLFGSTSSTVAGVLNAASVPTPGADNAEGRQGSSRSSSPIPASAVGGSRPTTTSGLVAQSLTTNNTTTTEDAESNFACLPPSGSFTSRLYEGGTTGLSFWIGKTTTDTMSLEISSSSRLPFLSETHECIREERDVYDVLDVEGGHRFQAGDWLVHNCMSPPGYAKVLLNVLADKKSGVTDQILHDIIIKNMWHMPKGDRVTKIMTMLGCSQTVAVSSYYIHKLFNEAYPEFRRTAYWLVKVIEEVAASGTDRDQAKRRIDEMYKTTDAPNRDLIGLEVDDDPLTLYPSVRACCGPWPRTVCWREPHMRKTDFAGADDQKKLTIRKATGEYKIFTPQLAIENVTQAAARNALCMGVEHLDNLGFKDVIHVHDEIMILCKRERESVLAAREAMLTCFGPKHQMPYGWSILVKPEEITLTESLYEDENDVAVTIKNKEGQEVPGPDRWGRIERNEPGCLLNLP